MTYEIILPGGGGREQLCGGRRDVYLVGVAEALVCSSFHVPMQTYTVYYVTYLTIFLVVVL